MFNQKPIQLTTGVITLSSLILLSFSSIGATQTETSDSNSDETEESITDLIPNRRRGGAGRSTTTVENVEDKEDENVEDKEDENTEIVQAPQRRKPAASRNDNQCNFNPQQLIALIPENLRGKTTATSPTLYFSVPAISANTEIEFVLRDTQDRLVEKQTFSGKGKAGIMGLKLPSVPRISEGNRNSSYHWYLSVICNKSDRAYDVVVEGLLQPVALEANVQQQLATANLEERIKLYQTYDLWHENLDTLATMKRSQPQNSRASQQLGQLLQSVKLDPSIGQQPLLGIQTLTSRR
ncbi:MAG: DUF928 domain-containing protein [Crocosphaera sp.]|uniref:DUF928 domain-containing protein n=3 Tax=Crocosphaera watsonii TaxID=263511 RepID=T2JLE1_CROWT|nr:MULTISPECIES: DUF928 domain-containing protein [Crocosphaera]EHJ12310.1 protein of unknown function DUF928 [Crocosphaera watsonii WH 0003]MCH2245314.1 DUF928 domain-containing protein [Crocosphaera sp.]CCQ54132.1 hypothetical protein CWATWH0005_538 [Crocosphaera watsonii WH 0005]CCQ65849.1 hypothetical protein CWATWH0402_3121 [Crocosphaera watsonii WH 0402]